jgi:hypothetical protein
MALPIRTTPTLTGKQAKRFLAEIKANEKKKVSQEELDRIKANYEIFKRIMEKSK